MSEKSLAAIAGFELPASLQAAQEAPAAVVSSLEWAPYITFAHNSRKDEWAKLAAQFGSVNEGDMYFIHGKMQKHLTSAKMGYFAGKQFWTHKSPAGLLLDVKNTPMPDPYRELVEAVVLLYIDGKAIPCNMSFHTTKCGAAKTMSDAFVEASSVDWGKRGSDYALTMNFPHVFLRFFAEVVMAAPRNSKRTGLPYRPLYAGIKPTTSTEIQMVQVNEDFNKQLELASKRFEYVTKELEAKLS